MLKGDIRKSHGKFLMFNRTWKLMLHHDHDMLHHCSAAERNWTGLESAELCLNVLWQRVWQRGRDRAFGVLQKWKCLHFELIGCIYTLHMCTGELVLKDRMQCFAICMIYKEHSWEEVRVFSYPRNWRPRWLANSFEIIEQLSGKWWKTTRLSVPPCVNLY